MKYLSKQLAILLFPALGFAFSVEAQIVYGTGTYFGSNFINLIKINTQTCEVCSVMEFPVGLPYDILVLPDGNLMVFYSSPAVTHIYDPPSNVPISTLPNTYIGGVVAPDGITVYLSSVNGLHLYDPITNTVSFLGAWPTGPGVGFAVDEMFFFNGQLYGQYTTLSPPDQGIAQVNISDPLLTTVLYSGTFWGGAGYTPGGLAYRTGLFSGNEDLYSYDPVTNTNTLICDLGVPATPGAVTSLTGLPPGVVEEECACISDAGTAAQTNVNPCVPLAAVISFNNNTQLDVNDIVRYILFTDPLDPENSIIQTSTSPIFQFIPPLQAGVTYFVARVVGNNLNGNIDFNDPCLDFSNFVELVWLEKPTVLLTDVSPTPLCAGTCSTVTVSFTGIPPFSINWRLQSGNTAISPLTNQVFSSSSGTFQVCVPPGVTGPVNVVVCSMSDAFCSNP